MTILMEANCEGRPGGIRYGRVTMVRRHALALLAAAMAGCAAALPRTATNWVISIEAKAPGHSAEHVEAQITNPLEGALENLPGMVRLMSRSFEATCLIELSFAARPTEAQLKSVAQVVQSQLARLAVELPAPTIAIHERRMH